VIDLFCKSLILAMSASESEQAEKRFENFRSGAAAALYSAGGWGFETAAKNFGLNLVKESNVFIEQFNR
jgi:hypothetical protein